MDPTPEELSALASRLSEMVSDLANKKDPQALKAGSRALVMEAKKLIWQVQDPVDAILDHSINAFINGSISSLLEIGVFEAVPPTDSATVEEIAKKCQADEEIIIRLMRQLVCVSIFKEVKLNEWAHTRLSITLSDHVGVSGKYFFKISQEEMAPALYRHYEWMRVYGKKDVLTYTETPHSQEFREVLTSTPERLDLFNRGLAMFEAQHPVVAIYPYEEKFQEGNLRERPSVVDIGGGRGRALLEFRKHCPSLKGELILQDRQPVLDGIAPEDLPGVTKMPHDFFDEQPVKNAQVYFIRRVFHDWQDKEAAQILQSIKPAMSSDSRIIISDMCIPEPVGIYNANAVWLDVMMMLIGGKERTKSDWVRLADLAGLKLVKVWQEPEKFGPLAVVEFMLPDASRPLMV